MRAGGARAAPSQGAALGQSEPRSVPAANRRAPAKASLSRPVSRLVSSLRVTCVSPEPPSPFALGFCAKPAATPRREPAVTFSTRTAGPDLEAALPEEPE